MYVIQTHYKLACFNVCHFCLFFYFVSYYRYACDIRVIRFLRERNLGNSPSRLVRQLRENHSEEWLKRVCRYLGACSDFAVQPSLHPVKFQDPPKPVAVPSHRWMLAVYGRDILSRIDQIKASITSTFGNILKMDSTKKVNILYSFHCKILPHRQKSKIQH